MTPQNYPLYRSQSAVMAAIQRLVAREGYLWYHLQTAPEGKILLALGKLHDRHLVLLDRKARHYRRESRLPVARVVLGPLPQGGAWPMVLLATERLKGERMHHVERYPLQWVAWRKGAWRPTYELRRGPRGGWTWYLVEAFYQELLEEALHHARRGDWPRLAGHLKTVGHLPMYRGIWGQAQEIRRRAQEAWGDVLLRSPEGQWRPPPWRKALEDWPKTPLSPVGMRLHVGPGEGRPRTVGEWQSWPTKPAPAGVP